ncbi:MAG: NAD(P)-dependent oxidoreductase [Acidobacteriaceae bacterium]|nr:NAD(P)-dependent oxidoreductase [Acidobacteriaceae bacterium]
MSQPDKVVVVGGAGFIGRRLTKLLLETGNRVTVVSRSAGSRRSHHPRLEYQTGNVSDAARMLEITEGASAVYELSLGGGQHWADYEREVIGGAVNCARACLHHGVRRMIYASSIAALYLGRGGNIRDTDANDANHPKRGMYSRGKSLAERKLFEMHVRDGLPVVIFRPGVVVGPGGALAHYAIGERPSDTCILGWGRGNHPLPFVLVDDVAQAMFLAKDAPGVEGMSFNLVGDVRPTAAEYVQYLRQRTLRNFRFYPRSVWLIQAAELTRWSAKKLARKRDNVLSPYRDLKTLTMTTQFDCSESKRLLHWKPVADREEFLRQAIDSLLTPIPAGDLRLEKAG